MLVSSETSKKLDYDYRFKFNELNGTSLCVTRYVLQRTCDFPLFSSTFLFAPKLSQDEAAVRSLSEELEELIFQQSAARTLRSFPGGWLRKLSGELFCWKFLFNSKATKKRCLKGLDLEAPYDFNLERYKFVRWNC